MMPAKLWAGLDDRVKWLLVALGLLAVVTWLALDAIEATGSEGAKTIARRLKRSLLAFLGLVVAGVLLTVAVVGAPWWVAYTVAVVALVGTGAGKMVLDTAGIPRPQGDTGDALAINCEYDDGGRLVRCS